MRGAVAAGRVDPDSIVGLGLDFTSCTVLPTLADGTPLARTDLATRPHAWPKLWKHHGAQRQATELTAVARERSEPWLDRYGGVVGLEWSFPKLLEVLDEDPAITEATEVWMEGGDWVVWQLTGARRRRRPDPGRPRAVHLPGGLQGAVVACVRLSRCRLPRGGAPRLRPPGRAGPRRLPAPGEAAGELSAAGAAALGLRAGVPVSAAVIDARGRARRRRERDRHPRPGPRHQRVPHGHGRRGAPDSGGGRCRRDGILPGSFGYETGQAAGDAFEWARP